MTKVLYYASGIFTGGGLAFAPSEHAGWCVFLSWCGMVAAVVIDSKGNMKN